MANPPSPAVDEFIDGLAHARRDEIVQLRDAILSIGLDISERVKWNAPSFCIDGDDRVTMRLQPGDRIELVFHRGAKKRDDVGTFRFDDSTGWLAWVSPDRGVVTLADASETSRRAQRIADLVRAWMLATRT